MRLHIAVERIEATLAAGTPKKGVARKTRRRRNAIRRAGRACWQVAEEIDIRIEQPGQLVVLPERIEFGQVGDIEALLFEAAVVEHGLQVVDDRIDVPMHLVERRLVLPVPSIAAGDGGVEARIDVDPAQADHTEWLPDNIDAPDWLPEADLEAELGWIAAEAGRHPARIRRVFLIKGCQGHSGNFEWEHARPAQVSDRVRELALAGNRLGLPDAKHQHDQQELKDGFHRHATGCRPG